MSNPYWNEVWERKGRRSQDSLRTSCGWEDTNCTSSSVYTAITDQLKITADDSILEVGCGSGYLANEIILGGHEYAGIDSSTSLIKAAKQHFKKDVFSVSEANTLPFESNSFDYVIAYSVFQYFPDRDYAIQCIDEMRRIARKGIFIGDIVETSSRDTHLKFTRDEFSSLMPPGVNISEGIYTDKRFNVYWLSA
jgi:ubiquinone/menaquinone biosynthesis C-methylase UbiE